MSRCDLFDFVCDIRIPILCIRLNQRGLRVGLGDTRPMFEFQMLKPAQSRELYYDHHG